MQYYKALTDNEAKEDMTPDLYSLRCYVALATHLSFRRAAETMHLSPAAFGDRIKRLEDEVGGALFERTTRSVSLTALGARLLPSTRRLLDESQRFAETAAEQGKRAPYALKLGTRYELGMSWIVPSLHTLSVATPERRIHVVMGSDRDLLDRLLRQSIDAVVSSVRLGCR